MTVKKTTDLSFMDRINPALKESQLDLTYHVSNRKARRFILSCIGYTPSRGTIRKETDCQAETIRQKPISARNEIVYTDSTIAKAGSKHLGVSFSLALVAKSPIPQGQG